MNVHPTRHLTQIGDRVRLAKKLVLTAQHGICAAKLLILTDQRGQHLAHSGRSRCSIGQIEIFKGLTNQIHLWTV